MGKIEANVAIPADPEKVWSIISTPGTYDQWLTIHTKWKGDVPETFSQGATVDEVVTTLGMANTIKWTVTEFDAPTKMTISGTGMAGVTTTFSLEVAADGAGGTNASIDAEFAGAMVVGALGKAVEQDAKASLDESMAKLGELAA